jgi:lysophospholipase L1-like esterase
MRATSLVLVLAAVGCSCNDRTRSTVAVNPHETAAVGSGAVPAVVSQQQQQERGALDAAPGTLDDFFRGLAAAEANDPAGRVDVVQLGDSHTAGDALTSRMRLVLQHQFGDAGRGLVGAGKPPYKHYYQRDVRYGASGKWTAAVGGHRGDSEPFGLGGIRVSGTKKGAQQWVETCSDCPSGKSTAQFEIFYYAAPDHGVLRYRVDDGGWQQVSTATTNIEPPHPGRLVVPVVDGPHKLTLEHGGGGTIDLFGVAMERLRPGVIVDSLGVVGRRLGSLRSWDWSIIGEQLATRDPKLVILQYGTNEADDPGLVLEDMARYYDDTILRIRAAAPTASILILGPPDMGVRAGGKSCDRAKKDAPVIAECEWKTPGILREIIAVEHAAAVRNKVAFYDTFSAMGGGDLMHGWVIAEPKIAYKDHVHLTSLGYERWADGLTGAVLDEYARWRKANGLPPSQPVAPVPSSHPAETPLPGPVPVTP